MVCGMASASASSSRPSSSAPDEHSFDVEADVVADLGGHDAVVARDDLDRDADPVELGDRGAGVGLRPVDEGEEADEVEVVLLGGRRLREAGGVAGGDGDHAGAVGEQALQGSPPPLRGGRRTAPTVLRERPS